ncbi:MAG: hypothetical protein GY744_02805 [Gammaproteobacteria bacterium]|nr:hypothetical protein [Gammaproteobacteria bacterium]
MKLIYRPLLNIQLRHSYYASGFSENDFDVHPSLSTSRLFSQYGLILRKNETGFIIYAEVDPVTVGVAVEDISPVPEASLKNDLLGENLGFSFFLQAKNNYLSNITALPRYNPGRQIFYVNNLRDDQEPGLLHLGDSFTDQRVGDAIALVSGQTLTYQFETAVNSADLKLDDAFGNTLDIFSFQYTDPLQTTLEYRVDLSVTKSMPPGRYMLTHVDSTETPLIFYFEPQLLIQNPVAVIEIFSSTVDLTVDNSEQVVEDYRFLVDNNIQPVGNYVWQLQARATTWRYNVIKKYDSSPYSLINLDDISDFDKTIDGDRAIYVADDERFLSELPAAIALSHSGTKLRNLPSPQLTTALQSGSGEGSYISDMYVYV